MAVGPRERAVAARYEHFAEVQAPGRSPLYAAITSAIASDRWMLAFLARMPEAKWQPNLLLGVVRYLYGTAAEPGEFIELVHANEHEISATMAVRRTQTNEPARCATLLPVLAGLAPPLALLEVGAAAGLCLLPDRYAYDYGRRRIESSATDGPTAPVFTCRAACGTPLPEHNVEVTRRAGLDLHPIDLAAQAPREATLVVFHTAVLAYVRDPGERAAFARSVAQLDAVWIANEGPENIPGVSGAVAGERAGSDDFLLCVDGQPIAWTDGHGTSIDWRAGA